MYFILVYDIAHPRRLNRVLKICRRYVTWVQNSVFEGELSPEQFERLIENLKRVIEKKEDSVIIYLLRNRHVYKRFVLGIEKNEITNILC
ncbi:MAG: CRISPR-associated endonuclease Cas2 [Bacteroidetes bacterium]|nr:CRISPR-associated endonuclease Cas2 [Bacteroidota bacterium]MBU2584299.1 CRISPR-associated endonuclease Cas2 [Bacteroidota bacterium]